MPSIKSLVAFIALGMSLALSGCGDKSSQAIFDTDSGKHPADWVQNHWVGVKKSSTPATVVSTAVSSCGECHGADLAGGNAGVSCFSPTRGAQNCHAGGPAVGHDPGWALPSQHGRNGVMAAPTASAGMAYCASCHGSKFDNTNNAASCAYNAAGCHGTAAISPHPPKPWHGLTTTGTNHVFADPANAALCVNCHKNGVNLTSVSAPVAAAAGTAAGCFNNTLCHDNGHRDSFKHDPSAADFHNVFAAKSVTSCKRCHGTTLTGGNAYNDASVAVPPCTNCHKQVPTGALASGCTSCHGTPPNGSVFPNIGGSHGPHTALPPVTGKCNSCHNGAGSGTVNHNNGTVNVSFLGSYKAKHATADPLRNGDGTCSNVSCHGGNPTPVWGGAIKPGCTDCHGTTVGTAIYTPEYNSYYSGDSGLSDALGTSLHERHLNSINPVDTTRNITCTDCHNTVLLTTAQHFSGLATHTFSGTQQNTIGGGTTYISNVRTDDNLSHPYYSYATRTSRSCNGVSCHPKKSLPPDGNKWWQN